MGVRARAGDQRVVDLRLGGRARPHRLHVLQGRRRAADQGPSHGVGAAGRERKRHRARTLPDRDEHGA